MKTMTTLPEGDWSAIVFRGDILFVSPQHPPYLFDVIHGKLRQFDETGVFALVVNDEPEPEDEEIFPTVLPPHETKQ